MDSGSDGHTAMNWLISIYEAPSKTVTLSRHSLFLRITFVYAASYSENRVIYCAFGLHDLSVYL
jgi:hypothetical protein